MVRFAVGALFGVIVGLVAGAALGIRAQEAYTAQDTLAAIHEASAETGVSESYLKSVVRCETGGTFDPYSVGRQGELGAAQLHPRGELPRFYAVGWLDPFSPYQAVRFMAQRFIDGGAGAWSCA
jgi:hypothetical protein